MKLSRLTAFLAGFLFVATSHPACSETYDTWAATHFTPAQIAAGIAAPNIDPDGDTCPNILEYAAGCLPNDADSTFAPDFAFDETLREVTVSFPFATNRDDIEFVIMVSTDLDTWDSSAIFVCGGTHPTYHLNGHRYARIGIRPRAGMMIDSDADGLSDHFEEALVATDSDDPFDHIGQILPGDDFDGDGTPNIDEEANAPGPGTFTKPATFDDNLVACALNRAAPSSPATLVVHTVLK